MDKLKECRDSLQNLIDGAVLEYDIDKIIIKCKNDLNYLIDIPKHETVEQWISVEDRLPEEPENYLVYDYISEKIGIREYYSNGFYSIDSDGEDGLHTDNITHWMPLPNKPEAENG